MLVRWRIQNYDLTWSVTRFEVSQSFVTKYRHRSYSSREAADIKIYCVFDSLITPSWNDDFKKIIVQACTMIDLSKWAIWACKITIVQKKSPGLLAPSSVEIFNFWTRRAWRLIFCQNDALMSTSFCQSFSFLANLWPAWRIKT